MDTFHADIHRKSKHFESAINLLKWTSKIYASFITIKMCFNNVFMAFIVDVFEQWSDQIIAAGYKREKFSLHGNIYIMIFWWWKRNLYQNNSHTKS